MHNPDYHAGSPDMKKTLSKENKLYKNALTNEFGDLKDDAKRIGKYALVAGGVAVGAYFLYQYLNKNNEEESAEFTKPKSSTNMVDQVVVEQEVKENPVMAYIKEQLAFLAITILREKLSELTGIDKNKLIKTPNESSKSSDQE
jgi:predicted alpha/beta-fold hydrolase